MLRVDEATAIDCAVPDPADGTGGAAGGDDEVADSQVLDCDVAVCGADRRARGKADGCIVAKIIFCKNYPAICDWRIR